MVGKTQHIMGLRSKEQVACSKVKLFLSWDQGAGSKELAPKCNSFTDLGPRSKEQGACSELKPPWNQGARSKEHAPR